MTVLATTEAFGLSAKKNLTIAVHSYLLELTDSNEGNQEYILREAGGHQGPPQPGDCTHVSKKLAACPFPILVSNPVES